MFNIYATDYAPVDPITPPCEITPIFIGYKGENKARCLVFDLTECVETFGDGGFVISFIRQGDELPYLVTDTDRLDNNAIWIITDTDTAVDGYGMVQLQYIVDDVVCKSALYRTVTFDSNSITGDVPDPYEDLLAQIAAYAAQAEGAATTATAAAQAASTAVENGITTERSQRIAADEGLDTRINELMGLAGAPRMAATAAAMTDSSKVYVYTGSEAGYLTGHWYYYNGTEWADGGVYQATAVDTDKTLTVENMAADAAVVGEKIDECMAAFVINSASGDIASFADGADNVPLKDLVVNITPKQAGTGDPSPSNVRAISGWTEANVTRTGKNLLNLNSSGGTYGGITATFVDDGTITFTGTSTTAVTIWIATNVSLKAGTYVLSMGYSTAVSGVTIRLVNMSNTVVYTTSTHGTFTTTDDAVYRYVAVRINSGVTLSNLVVKPMIYPSGFSDDSFEMYKTPTVYNVSFGTAGTVYGGTLDVTTGMLTVTHGRVDLGTLPWYYSSAYTMFFAAFSEAKANAATGWADSYSYIGAKTDSAMSSAADYSIACGPGAGYVKVKDSRYTVNTDFKTAVTGKYYVYELAQPVSYQLTPTEVKTLLGINNIWADTGDITNLEYRADTKLYIEHLTTPDGDMIADANITSGSYFMVNNSLYLATANIANGGAITPGTNCTVTNLAAALNAINS